MRSRRLAGLILLAGLLAFAAAARAEVKLPALFGDNMVLQRDVPIPVWGTAEPGEQVSVAVGEHTPPAVATADAQGRWQVKLDARPAGGPFTLTVTGKNTLTLNNVLVGEVWVCSGQSNMWWAVGKTTDAAKEIPAANCPKLRLFTVQNGGAAEPQRDLTGSWAECSAQNAGGFSGVGYYFGRELLKSLDVPVGLIHSSVPGTSADLWTPLKGIETDADLKLTLDRLREAQASLATKEEDYKKRLAAWQVDVKKAQDAKRTEPKKPNPPGKPNFGSLYNGKIAPLIPYAIRGVIWYQGESDAGRPEEYAKLFPGMIRAWRTAWGQGDFPFLFVQLAAIGGKSADPNKSGGWAWLRDAQRTTLSLPNTGMAVYLDDSDGDLHPKNKLVPGGRLAKVALATVYTQKVAYAGPQFAAAKVEGDKMRVTFTEVGGGLVCKGAKLGGFALAGEDRNFVWADAKIDGDAVVVWSDKVPKPVAVRYGWADHPECSLYNREDLPAVPFRSDDWPRIAPQKGK